jgi:hypothetical protein
MLVKLKLRKQTQVRKTIFSFSISPNQCIYEIAFPTEAEILILLNLNITKALAY